MYPRGCAYHILGIPELEENLISTVPFCTWTSAPWSAYSSTCLLKDGKHHDVTFTNRKGDKYCWNFKAVWLRSSRFCRRTQNCQINQSKQRHKTSLMIWPRDENFEDKKDMKWCLQKPVEPDKGQHWASISMMLVGWHAPCVQTPLPISGH